MNLRQLLAPRFGSPCVSGVPLSDMLFVWLGCVGVVGLSCGIVFVVARDFSSRLQLLCRGLLAKRVAYLGCSGCVSLECGLSVGMVLVDWVLVR